MSNSMSQSRFQYQLSFLESVSCNSRHQTPKQHSNRKLQGKDFIKNQRGKSSSIHLWFSIHTPHSPQTAGYTRSKANEGDGVLIEVIDTGMQHNKKWQILTKHNSKSPIPCHCPDFNSNCPRFPKASLATEEIRGQNNKASANCTERNL